MMICINRARASKKVTDWSEKEDPNVEAWGDPGHAYALGYHYTTTPHITITIINTVSV